jgi:hypothetical protein
MNDHCVVVYVDWQVELFCVGNLINCVLEADEEFLCMDFHFTLRDGGMRASFQLLHMVLARGTADLRVVLLSI